MSRIAILSLVLLTSACAMDPKAGYTPMRAEAVPYDQAHAQCWERSMSLLGGVAMDMARERAYQTCMSERGWSAPHMPFEKQPETSPGSSGR